VQGDGDEQAAYGGDSARPAALHGPPDGDSCPHAEVGVREWREQTAQDECRAEDVFVDRITEVDDVLHGCKTEPDIAGPSIWRRFAADEIPRIFMISSLIGALTTAATAIPAAAEVRSLKKLATSTEMPAPQRNAFQRMARGSGSSRSSHTKSGIV
jgi:hypothetical protein